MDGGFWMDTFKTHCFATFESVDQVSASPLLDPQVTRSGFARVSTRPRLQPGTCTASSGRLCQARCWRHSTPR